MDKQQIALSPSMVGGEVLTIDELLKSLQKIKKTYGGATIVAVCLDVPDSDGVKALYAINSIQSAESPPDSIFKGATIGLVEAIL